MHLRVPPSAFAATFNAAQTAIAPILAASVNSPILLERLLWQETRVALFAQAVDDRAPVSEEWLPVAGGVRARLDRAGRWSRSPRASRCTCRCCRC